jgi:hypothetical protein
LHPRLISIDPYGADSKNFLYNMHKLSLLLLCALTC